MERFILKIATFILLVTSGNILMAQSPISIKPENATAWNEITLTLDVSMSCPAEALYFADSVMMRSGVTIDGYAWSNEVAFDDTGANGQYPKLVHLNGFQDGISMSPPIATAWDEVTITLDAKASCPADELLSADSVMMHSGVTIDGIVFSNIIPFDGTGANGQKPKMTDNGDSTYSFTFIPAEFYGIEDGANVEAINCVFNGGSWLNGWGRAFNPQNPEECMDFLIPFNATDIYKWEITFIPADFYGIEEGTNVTAINCVFNAGDPSAGEGKDWDPENPEACIDFIVPLGNVGISENPRMTNFNLYPNPAGDQLTVDNIDGVNKIEVFNVMGEVVKSINNLSTAAVTIRTSDLTSGVYFITLYNENDVQTTKFIKK
jgi:hypothetical protein